MKIFTLLIFLMILPVAFAESEIFSGTALTDTDILTSAGIFRLKYDEASDKIFAQTPTTNMIVDNGACKSNEIFRVCINSANFSSRDENFQSYYDVNADIYRLTESLEASVTAVQAALMRNEQTGISINMKNPANIDATNVEFYLDTLNLTVTDVKGCTLSGNSIVWKGDLKANYPKECTATIQSSSEGTYSLSGTISYFNGYEKQNNSIQALSIEVLPDQINIIEDYGNIINLSSLETEDSFYANFSLQNIHDTEDADISITITLPPNAYLLNDPPLSVSGSTMKKTFTLKPGAFFNYSLYLKASTEGSSSLRTSVSYTIQNINNNYEKLTETNVREPRPVIEIIPEYDTLLPGQKFIVSARISNPSPKYGFSDMIAKLSIPFNSEVEEKLDSLAPNETSTIISKVFLLPEGANAGKLPINMELDYKLGIFSKSQNKLIELEINGSGAQIAPETLDNSSAEADQNTAIAHIDESSGPEQADQQDVQKEIVIESSFSKRNAILVGLSILVIILLVPSVIFYKRRKKQVSQQTQHQNPPQS